MFSRAALSVKIAAMKHFLLLLLPLALCALSVPSEAAAASPGPSDGGYAVINARDVGFFEQPDENTLLFLLPYTYYVRVCGTEGDFTAVEYAADRAPYAALTGYCRTDELTFVDYVPRVPYLEQAMEITYSVQDNGGAGTSSLLTVKKQAAFYGHRYLNGQLYCYVLCDGEFGRVAAERLPDYPLNTEYEDYLASLPPEQANGAENGEGGLSAAAIVAICVGCVAVVAIAVFVARGKRPPAYDPERAEF